MTIYLIYIIDFLPRSEQVMREKRHMNCFIYNICQFVTI